MAKCSYELKMEVVQAYLNAEGSYRYLARKYNIPDKSIIREWLHSYREFDKEGLKRSRKNKIIHSNLKFLWYNCIYQVKSHIRN